KGLKIRAVATSASSRELAERSGILLIDIDQVTRLDLTVDGADEVDRRRRMIKGGGGALLREKILASMSADMIAIVDESKLVPKLGRSKLPVEVVPFGMKGIEFQLRTRGFQGTWRL